MFVGEFFSETAVVLKSYFLQYKVIYLYHAAEFHQVLPATVSEMIKKRPEDDAGFLHIPVMEHVWQR